MLFAYHLELNLLRTLAADDNRILLLLPGKRERGKIILFPDLGHGLTQINVYPGSSVSDEGSYTLPSNLIAENHLWELKD
jgi:hypothetical protein